MIRIDNSFQRRSPQGESKCHKGNKAVTIEENCKEKKKKNHNSGYGSFVRKMTLFSN